MNQLDFLANTLAEEMQKKSISHSTYKINLYDGKKHKQ